MRGRESFVRVTRRTSDLNDPRLSLVFKSVRVICADVEGYWNLIPCKPPTLPIVSTNRIDNLHLSAWRQPLNPAWELVGELEPFIGRSAHYVPQLDAVAPHDSALFVREVLPYSGLAAPPQAVPTQEYNSP